MGFVCRYGKMMKERRKRCAKTGNRTYLIRGAVRRGSCEVRDNKTLPLGFAAVA
jgi:hypothetical protein